jgi:hypothetical protein
MPEGSCWETNKALPGKRSFAQSSQPKITQKFLRRCQVHHARWMQRAGCPARADFMRDESTWRELVSVFDRILR